MEVIYNSIPGCYELEVDDFNDERGGFFKTFHIDLFKKKGLETNWREEYYSTSKKNVIRGMHFQTPPEDHNKLVTCLSGSVIDVIIDLRKDSPMFKKHIVFHLMAKSKNRMLYIPKGCAHGFLSLEDDTLMNYKVSTIYSPDNDKGILWNSFGFEWKTNNPIISNRDKCHPSINEFNSPF
jgi:dTDP-4-dehydrorhamnose 3,5-epimerase